MYCSKCGSDIPQESQFCPSCGCSQSQPSQPAGKKKRSSRLWFFILFSITLVGVVAGFYASYNSAGGMGQAAEDQLRAIKTNQLTKAYYGYTSKDFQESTSLDNFRKYVRAHPVLIENADITFHNRSIDNNIGTLEGILTASNGTALPIRYQMVKEDNEWKILNIELGRNLPQPQAVPLTQEASKELEEPVREQLQAIRSGNMAKAYNDYTSADFREATPLEKFSAFISSYPILASSKEVSFKESELLGDRAHLLVFFDSPQGPIPAEYKLVKENGKWKIWSLHLLLPPAEEKTKENSDQLVPPVSRQLEALRKGDIPNAYSQVSNGFKLATSPDEFKAFVNTFPAITKGAPSIKEHYFDKGTGKVMVLMESEQGSQLIEYTLAKEEGEWKVWGMRVMALPYKGEPLSENDTAQFNEADLLKPIQDQMNLIRSGDYTKAYNDYTSSAFKMATSQEQFDHFLKSYAIFNANSALSFNDLTFENNVAIYKGVLTAKDGSTAPVEYDLVKEGGSWKILSIRVLANIALAQEPIDPSKPLAFTAMAIGTEVDLAGRILNPSTHLSSDAKDIYATLAISNGKKGDKVEVTFEHSASGSQIPPVTAELERDGAIALSFVFTPPAAGWPTGGYLIKAASSSGVKAEFPFTIGEEAQAH